MGIKPFVVKLYTTDQIDRSNYVIGEVISNALVSEFKTNESIKYNLEIVPSQDMPELSIIHYLMWAVQRKLLQGESRYFDALRNKYGTVLNLYEEE